MMLLVAFVTGLLIGYFVGLYYGVARGLAARIDPDDIARRVREYVNDHERAS